jgi:hypothetical protein
MFGIALTFNGLAVLAYVLAAANEKIRGSAVTYVLAVYFDLMVVGCLQLAIKSNIYPDQSNNVLRWIQFAHLFGAGAGTVFGIWQVRAAHHARTVLEEMDKGKWYE